jgi:hypothetical protein
MKNWKTTTIGILTIVVAIASPLLEFLKAGSLPDLTATFAAVTAGFGLVMAKDASQNA